MGKSNFWSVVGIVLLVLVLMGVVSVGDIVGLAFRIIMGFIIFIAFLWLFLRYQLRKARRNMTSGGQSDPSGRYGHYHYSTGGGHNRSRNRNEGDVTIQKNSTQSKERVNKRVGDYVDYEEM